MMNSRWLWNSRQRHKFLRAEASRNIFKFQSLRNGISRGILIPPRMPCCFVRLGTVPQKCPRRSKTSHWFEFTDLKKGICIQCYSKVGSEYFTILFSGAYFLLAAMVEEDESSQLRMANQPVVLAGYQPLLTALHGHTA